MSELINDEKRTPASNEIPISIAHNPRMLSAHFAKLNSASPNEKHK